MKAVWNASRLCLYLLWLAADGLPAHSYNAWAEYGASIGNMFRFDGAIFDSVIFHHFKELGVGRVAGHGVGLTGKPRHMPFSSW
jgi:hypothetical protein